MFTCFNTITYMHVRRSLHKGRGRTMYSIAWQNDANTFYVE